MQAIDTGRAAHGPNFKFVERFLGRTAKQHAALAALRGALSAVRCAATLLVTGAQQDRDRGLGLAILQALNSADSAIRRLEPGPDPRLN